MMDIKTLYIFILGAILTLLYYVEEIIEEQEYKQKAIPMIISLALVKSILGGVLIVLIYYTLQELKIEFVIFDMAIKFGDYTNLFIAGAFSLFGSDMFRMFKSKLERTLAKETNQWLH